MFKAKLQANLQVKLLISLFFTLILVACGGGGGGGASTANSTVTPTALSGYATKAPLTNAQCTLYNAANQALGTVQISANGTVNFGQISEIGYMTASCTGGSYTDEATGASTTSTTMRSSVYVSGAGGSLVVVISPLSEMAMQRAGGNPAEAAAQAKIIAKAVGLDNIDILSVLPTDLNKAAATNDAQGRYGTVLAAFAQMMKDQGKTLDQLVSTFVTTTSSIGTLRADVSSLLQTAVSNLTDSAKNSNTSVRTNANSTVSQAVLGTTSASADTTPFANSLVLTTTPVSPSPNASPQSLRVPMLRENMLVAAALGSPANTVLTPIWGQTYTAVAMGGNLAATTLKVSGMTCAVPTVSSDGKTLSASCTMNSYGGVAQLSVQKANQTIIGSQPSASYFFSNGASSCAGNTVIIGSISPLTAAYAEQGKAFTVQGCNLSVTANATLDGASVAPEANASADQASYRWNITNTRVAGNAGSLVIQGRAQAITYTAPTVTLTAVTPNTATKGGAASSNLTLTGTGFYTGMAVTLVNATNLQTACTGGLANSTATQLSGVNCSGVTYSLSASSAALNVASNSGAALNITLQDAPQSSLALSVNKSSIQLGSSGALVSATSNSAGAITYASSDPTIATVDAASGVVMPIAIGTATITASQAAVVGQYALTTKTTTISVAARTSPALVFAQTSKTLTLGNADFTNAIATKTCATEAIYNPTVTYSIVSGSAFINLDGAGVVALKGAGSATVQASVAQVGTCAAQTASYNITISKATPTLSMSSTSVSVVYGAAAFVGNTASFVTIANNGTVALPVTSGLSINYSSSNTAVATVSNIGLISVVGAGSAVISATSSGDSNYNAVTTALSYTVTVGKAIPTISLPAPSLFLDTDASGKANAATLSGVAGGIAPTGALTYSSSNTSVLLVGASTGTLVPVGQGTANVNVSYAGDVNYTVLSASSSITVSDTAPVLKTACTGVSCGAASATSYSGSGVGVWKLSNTTGSAVTFDIDIDNVLAGKAVTLAFTNGGIATAGSLPTFGTQMSTEPAPPQSFFNLEANAGQLNFARHQAHDDAHNGLVGRNKQLAQSMRNLPRTASAEAAPMRNTTPYATPSVGGVRSWVDYYAPPYVAHASTAQFVCSLPNGRNVVFWKADADTVLTPSILNTFTNNMCGVGKGFDKLMGLTGDAWGTHVYPSYFISDGGSKQQDINIAFVNAGNTGWAGYFWGQNNYKVPNLSGVTNTNQALVFFINTYSLASDVNYYLSTLIHEAKHMIGFYQSDVISQSVKITDTWYEETSAMMAEDIIVNDLIGYNKIAQYRLPSYMNTGANVSLNNWPSLSSNNYAMGGTLGAFLNRRYGTGLFTQSITGCMTGASSLSSYTCVDGLIKAAGGTGLADEIARMGASVFAKLPSSGMPSGIGYPAMTSNGFGLVGIDTSVSVLAAPSALTSYLSMSQTFLNEVQSAGKTRFIRRNVVVPAGTALYLVVK